MDEIEQKRAARRKKLGTDEQATIIQKATETKIINANPVIEQPALFEQGARVNGWVLTPHGWEYK